MSVLARRPRFDLNHIAIGTLLLGSLVVHAVVPMLAWRWSSRPFIGALLDHTLAIRVVQSHLAGWATTLLATSRVTAIDRTSVANRRDLESVLQTYPIGSTVVLTIQAQQKDGSWMSEEKAIVLGPFPLSGFLAYFLVPYLVGLVYLASGIWCYWRSRSDREALDLALLCAVASVLLATTFDALTTHLLMRVWAAAWPLAGIAFCLLALGLMRQRDVPGARQGWRQMLQQSPPVVVGTALAAWVQVVLYSPDPRFYLSAWRANCAFLAACFGALIGVLLLIRLRPSLVQLRVQAQVVLLGAVVSSTPLVIWASAALCSRLFPAVFPSYPFQPALFVPTLAAFPLVAVYALYRHASLGPDLLLGPFSRRRNYREALRELSRELSASLYPDDVMDRLLACVGTTLDPKQAYVFVVSPATGHYELTRTWGEADTAHNPVPMFTPQQHAVQALLRRGESVAVSPRAAQVAGLPEMEREQLRRLGIVLLSPIKSKDHLLGILALGPLPSGDRYADDDIAFLSTVADLAAAATENASLYLRQAEQERNLVAHTRQLTEILALGNQLKSLDRETVVQRTVDAIRSTLGFELVTLSLVEQNDPGRVRVAAWAGTESIAWERLSAMSFPLVNLEAIPNVQKLGTCYFVPASGTGPDVSTWQAQVPWQDGDQLLVQLATSDGLVGYLSVDKPVDGLRPTEGKMEVLEIFANQAALAIQNANLYASIDRALDERVAELATLQEIDRQINMRLDFDRVMDMTLEWAMRITAATAGTVCLVSSDHRTLQVVAHRGYPPEMEDYWTVPWPIEEGIFGQVISSGSAALIADVTQNSEHANPMLQTRSHLSVPIIREDDVIGIISLESTEPHGFSADHLAFLMRLADHATIAIENARLYEQTSRRVAELTTLQKISLDLTSRLNLNAVLDSIAVHTRELTRADQITIYLYDAHQDLINFGTGLSDRGEEERPPIPIEQNELTRTVVRKGEPMVIHDTRGHPFFAAGDWEIGAIASMPLRKADRVLGAFDVSFHQAHFFAPEELRALSLLADQAAVAIENAQLYAEAQRADEAKHEFVGLVSSTVRPAITSIQGYARLLTLGAGTALTGQQREFVEVISKATERIDRMVTDLLDLSRVESGRVKLELRPIDLPRTIQDAVRALQGEIEARSHELTVEIPKDLPEVMGDRARLTQVWSHLLSNAVRYTPDHGHIRVFARPQVSLESNGPNTQRILCAVQDSGVGIAPEEQRRIFDPLYRARRPEVSPNQGAGLGLPLVRSIVELHGGRVWFQSQPGQGSTFYFTLPIALSTTASQ